MNKYSSAHVSLGPDSPNVYSRAAEISVMVDVFSPSTESLKSRDWRDGSVVESTCCFCRGPGFDFPAITC